MLKSSRIAILYTYQFITFVLFSVFVMPIAIFFRSQNKPWVISGHRGKIYQDNSAALHKYILGNTSQNIIWLCSNQKLYKALKQNNISVLKRNSFKGRLAIVLSPVLIYSHGEDDLELFMLFWRKILGSRFYLMHCLNHLKTGDCARKDYIESNSFSKAVKRFFMTDFEYLVCASASEQEKFIRTLPHRKDDIKLGGGAHLDYFFENKNTPTEDNITYFPTHRDTVFGKKMQKEIINQIIADKDILDYLNQEKLKFNLCMHINSASLNIENLPDCFAIKETSDITNILAKTKLLISDYSSLLLDYLIFEKPIILFPFDLDDYTNKRNFFQPYESLNFSKINRTYDEFKSFLISNEWKNIKQFSKERKIWHDEIFPYKEPTYSKNTYQRILELK